MSFQDKALPSSPAQVAGEAAAPSAAAAQGEMLGMRLQAFLSHAGVSSRRTCAKIIEAGRVVVNGARVTERGFRVAAEDEVLLDGKRIYIEKKMRYVLLNKPAGYVSTLTDEKGRATAASLVAGLYPERLYNVGRLDMLSEGALIFTNDGGFAQGVAHPSSKIEKEYIVDAAAPFADDALKAFARGVWIKGSFFKAERAERLKARRARVVLVEGKNREIRRVFAGFGIAIKRLKRVRIGPVMLGQLAAGEARDLTIEEIEGLRGHFKKQ